MSEQSPSSRAVAFVRDAIETFEGEGFRVRRPFPIAVASEIDPFLLLDEMGPMDLGPGEAKGASDHPHRGFETVTYMLAGRMEHRDSQGNVGQLTPGDVQWMTAGAGVIHSEMPEETFLREGGRMHGLQLWVNLPSGDKLMQPRYQDIPASRIPVASSEDGGTLVRVIAGESMGKSAVIETRTPILYLHVTLKPGARFVQPVPLDFNVFAYIIDGSGMFGSSSVPATSGQMVVFESTGDEVVVTALEGASEDPSKVLDFVLIGGRPLNEPVARYGPFVMNTEEEIHQAITDFRNGTFGEISS